MTLQIRRGVRADLPTSLDVGEPGWVTDDEVLVIGTGTGTVEINPAGSDDPASFTPITTATTTGTVDQQIGRVITDVTIPAADRRRLFVGNNGTAVDLTDDDTFAEVNSFTFDGNVLTLTIASAGTFTPTAADVEFYIEDSAGAGTIGTAIADVSDPAATDATSITYNVTVALAAVLNQDVRDALIDFVLVPGVYAWNMTDSTWDRVSLLNPNTAIF